MGTDSQTPVKGFIHPTAVIYPGVQLGVGVFIGAYVVLGASGEAREPKWKPIGRVTVGDHTVISEHARIQSGIVGTTTVGAHGLIMAGGHIAHDCRLGDYVTTAAHVALGGHTVLEDYSFVGTSACTHQHARLGEGSLLGAGSFLKGDTDDWGVYAGSPATYRKVNRVGRTRFEQGYYSP